MRLVAVLGSATPPGRLRAALETALGVDDVAGELIDLAEHRIAFADGRPLDSLGDDTAAVVGRLRAAEIVLLASPVYRGSTTGVLKNLLDHVPLDALASKPVGIVAMGASPHHYLGVDSHLRAVLAWFGALVAPTSVYLGSADFVEGRPSEGAREELASLVRTLVRLAGAAPPGAPLGPTPLAARR